MSSLLNLMKIPRAPPRTPGLREQRAPKGARSEVGVTEAIPNPTVWTLSEDYPFHGRLLREERSQ